MKFSCTLLLLFALHLTITAQIDFEDHLILDNGTSVDQPSRIAFADIDGDGDTDLLSASREDDKIAWYENLDGLGTFSDQVILNSQCLGASSVAAADIDGDGDIDVVSAASSGGFFGWITKYENLDGLGTFGPPSNLSSEADGPQDVLLDDMNLDGYVDAVASSLYNSNVKWWSNDGGSGSFLGDALPVGNGSYVLDLHISDLNGDGEKDVLMVSSQNGVIGWYENNLQFGIYSYRFVSDETELARGVFAADIDGDGDQDLLSASSGDNKIAWYENLDGLGDFSDQLVITTTAESATSVFATDLDGDGDVDVLSSSEDDNTIAWYENTNGQGAFGPKQVISTKSMNAQAVYAEDIDLDGDMDVFSVSSDDDKISWFRNLDGQATFSEEIIITFRVDTPYDVFAADMDNDGDLDILSASRHDNKIAWYPNTNGSTDFGNQQLISGNAMDAFSVTAADLDGDGDNDVISASIDDNKLAWYENTNDGDFETEHLISIEPSLVFSVETGDVDSDGDMDLVIVTLNSVGWFENLDGQANFSAKQEFSSTGGSCDQLYLTDLDGDGDLDVHYGLRGLNQVVWHENTDGLGGFGPAQMISDTATSANSAHAADVDGDGDMDIVSSLSNRLVWYRNEDGLGSFSDENVVLPSTGAVSAFFADIDGDGDNDIVAGMYAPHFISWIENIDGLGNFGTPQSFSDDELITRKVHAFDKDGDGDVDVAYAGLVATLGWIENLIPTSNQVNGIVIIDTDVNGCDVNDVKASSIKIISDNGTNELSTFSIANGVYQLYPGLGDFTTSIELPTYYDATPISFTSSFTDLGNTLSNDFCLTPNQTINDVRLSIYPLGIARPGFLAHYQIVFYNTGTTVQSGSITIDFDNTKVFFSQASETVASQSSNSVTFDYVDLDLFETRFIDLDFMLEAPPITNNDDILTYTTSITPIAGDYEPSDNTHIFDQVAEGSFDPNDIRVLEGDKILEEEIDNYLHYIIRFQNTGTASAINVRVENVLDDDLDWNTFQMESSSHTHLVEIVEGNEVSFIFDNINLPDSTSNEPESHGFIAYKIKPDANAMLGTVFTNQADIYFDFNEAVVTNMVTTTVVELDSIPPMAICQDISVYLDENGNATIEAIDLDNGSTDNVEIVDYNIDVNIFDCTNIGTVNANLTVTDDFDNSNSCLAAIMVLDTLSPESSMEVLSDINAECEVTELPAPEAFDNCSGTIVGTHETSLPITSQDTTIVNWTYEDNDGNTFVQTQNVIIADNTNPIAISQDITIDLDGAASISISPDQIDAGSSDNCEISELFLDVTSFNTPGVYNVILTVEDSNNNLGTATAVVTVIDSSISSVSDKEFSARLTVIPNPTSGIVKVESSNELIASLVVYSELGKAVKQSSFGTIDISSLTDGNYILKIITVDGKKAFKRIVKIK